MKKKTPFSIIHNYTAKTVKHITADFETCKTEDGQDVRVWAWGVADIFTEEFGHGTDINSFIEHLTSDRLVYDVGIHNLKFDGNFILPALYKLGYKFVDDKTFLDMFLKGDDISNVFTHNITSMGQWFNILIGKKKRGASQSFVYLWDTLKLFDATLKQVGMQYCKVHKKIDEDEEFYSLIRPVGHQLTAEELLYLKEDCLVLAEALRGQYDKYKKIYRTRASKAFAFFKECACEGDKGLYTLKYEGVKQLTIPKIAGLEEYEGLYFRELPFDIKNKIKALDVKLESHLDYYIPNYHTWWDLKQSYRGGISYVDPRYRELSIKDKILVLDVNSMYPYCLREFKIPYGKFTYHRGKPEEIANTTWIACARVSFKLKKSTNLPCIQIKEKYGREWLRESTDYKVEGEENPYNEDIITFTEIDYQTFCENYDFTVHEWIYHYRFNLFSNKDGMSFVDTFYALKMDADKRKSEIEEKYPNDYKTREDWVLACLERQEAKIILNSAYGKFGTKYVLLSKFTSYVEGEPIQFTPQHENFNKEPDDPSHYYLPYASFVTSYARRMLVRAWNSFDGRAVYCDTDSLHIIGGIEDIPESLHPIIDWDKTGKLGLWKIEGEFTKARYIRSKTYIEVDGEGKEHITCAGAPDAVKKLMTWDNFRTGFRAWGELEKKYEGDELEKAKLKYSKLVPKQYPSGVDLVPCDFQIN